MKEILNTFNEYKIENTIISSESLYNITSENCELRVAHVNIRSLCKHYEEFEILIEKCLRYPEISVQCPVSARKRENLKL